MKPFVMPILLAACVLAFTGVSADADAARKLPAFEMKDLAEREYRLTDQRFRGKRLLIAAFGTWQQVSIDQALELEKFHKANPDVEIIAFVVDELATARDFVQRHGLSYPCYKTDAVTRIPTAFNRLFKTREGKTLTLNRAPCVILADAERNVTFAEIGLVGADKLSAELR